MQLMWINASALAVVALYYLHRAYAQARQRRRGLALRHRVAYMLWVAAQTDADPVEAGSDTLP